MGIEGIVRAASNGYSSMYSQLCDPMQYIYGIGMYVNLAYLGYKLAEPEMAKGPIASDFIRWVSEIHYTNAVRIRIHCSIHSWWT
jgi:hypothetical protein